MKFFYKSFVDSVAETKVRILVIKLSLQTYLLLVRIKLDVNMLIEVMNGPYVKYAGL